MSAEPEVNGRVELLELCRRVVAAAGPGEQVEAFAARSRRVNVRAYRGEVEAFTSAETAGIGVRVIADGRVGFAHAGTLDPASVLEVLAEARDNRTFAEPDPWAGLVEPDGVPEPVLDLVDPGLGAFTHERRIALAVDLERAVIRRDPRITGVRIASYGDGYGEAAIASTTGIERWGEGTSAWLSVTALASDGTETHVGGGVDVGRGPDELDVEATAADAVERATRLLGARRTASRRLTVVLDRRVAASVLGVVAGMLSGERVVKGRTPFRDRMGEVIASPLLTLVDDATDPASLGADSFDGEGLATRRSLLIDGGVLRAFSHNGYTARRLGTRSTASAVRGYASTPGVGALALAPSPGTASLEEMVAGVGDGILVQSVTGLHSGVNAVSGDFSVGAEGLLIRGGALAEPVREVTIASTLPRMLQGIIAMGADVERLPGGDTAVSMVIDEMSLSGE
jgi:PmbA protein